MADVSPILNQLADDMAAWAAGPFAELLAENTRSPRATPSSRARNAAESTAAERAASEWNRIVAPVSETPEVPTEIPPVEVPTEPGPVDQS